MFSSWLVVVVVVLTASANQDRAAVARGTVTVGPTSEVKGQQEAELTLNCGNGKSSGLVRYWHTPFGDLKRPGFVERGPVLMRSDGTLVVFNCSRRHSSLYYCLLQDPQGTTLWPYQVHIHPDHGGQEEVQVVSRRVIGSDDGEGGVSQQDLAAAVAAAVLLTFVVGFSAGALSRTYVLRCLGAVRTRIRSPRQQSDQTDRSGVTMTTLPPWYGHQEAEPVDCNETMETTVSSTASSPPIKPKRSFRHKGDEEEETRVYLEGCGHAKEEETTGYLEGCGHIKEEEEEGLEEEGTYGGLYLSGGDEEEEREDEEEEEERREEKESQRRKEEEKGDEEEEADEEERREEKESQRRKEEEKGDEEEEDEEVEEERREETQRRKEEGGTVGGLHPSGGDEEEETKRRQEEKEGDEEEKEEEERREEKETRSRRQEEEKEEGEEVQSPHSETSSEGGDTKPEAPSETRRRRSRVIRLYQYDDEGQRYCHLPDPAPDEPGPAPRLRQRSVSLTRLNAIMAAASAGPLDSEGDAGRREETRFHMDI